MAKQLRHINQNGDCRFVTHFSINKIILRTYLALSYAIVEREWWIAPYLYPNVAQKTIV